VSPTILSTTQKIINNNVGNNDMVDTDPLNNFAPYIIFDSMVIKNNYIVERVDLGRVTLRKNSYCEYYTILKSRRQFQGQDSILREAHAFTFSTLCVGKEVRSNTRHLKNIYWIFYNG
jgi:hypothetical protein